MKATLQLHLINSEAERDQAGMGSRPRLRSIVAGLTPEGGQKAAQEEWRPRDGESQFDCFTREFKEQYSELMPEFFATPTTLKESVLKGPKPKKAAKKNK